MVYSISISIQTVFKGVAVIEGAPLHMHLNCVHWDYGSWKDSTPYLSLYPSELCSTGLWWFRGSMSYPFPSELSLKGLQRLRRSTPYPSPSELCSMGYWVVKGAYFISVSIAIWIVFKEEWWLRGSTPYPSLYPSSLCPHTNTYLKCYRLVVEGF